MGTGDIYLYNLSSKEELPLCATLPTSTIQRYQVTGSYGRTSDTSLENLP